MNIQIKDLIHEVREYYLTRLLETIAEESKQYKVITEAALRNADGKYAVEGELSLPYRVDCVSLDSNGNVVHRKMIDTESYLNFNPIECTLDGKNIIELRPFQWNYCRFTAFAGDNNINWEKIRLWFLSWFEERTEGPLYGCLHFMSDPRKDDDLIEFFVDFGSAPTTAFEELIGTLNDMGFTRISVGF